MQYPRRSAPWTRRGWPFLRRSKTDAQAIVAAVAPTADDEQLLFNPDEIAGGRSDWSPDGRIATLHPRQLQVRDPAGTIDRYTDGLCRVGGTKGNHSDGVPGFPSRATKETPLRFVVWN